MGNLRFSGNLRKPQVLEVKSQEICILVSRLAATKFGFASRAIFIAHCKMAHPPFVSTAKCVGPTVGSIDSFTSSRAESHATLTIDIPMPMDRCG
jgi:hypothetical protein